MEHPLERLLLHRRSFCAAGLASLAWRPAQAQGQTGWPNRPISLVVPFAPAGSNDIFARAVAQELTTALKQPVIVENKPGAGSMLGAGQVAKAAADGYTLMLASSTVTIGGTLKKGLPFDVRRDFTPVALIARGPLMVVASPGFPASTPAELIALARSAPGKYTFGSSGPGSTPQMGMELLTLAAGIRLLHIPYKGGAPVLNDLMGGQVDLYMGSLPQVLPLVRTGKVKPIGVTSLQHIRQAPEVSPFGDVLPNFSFEVWWGLFGPGNLPRDIVARLNTEVGKALQTPAMRQYMENEGAVAGGGSAEQFAAFVAAEVQNWQTVGKRADISLD